MIRFYWLKFSAAVQKVLKSAIRVTLPRNFGVFQGLTIRKMRSRNKFGMTRSQAFWTAA